MGQNMSDCDEILFLSGIYPLELGNQLTDPAINRNIQVAADLLQKNIICGLESCNQKPIQLLNAPYVGVYPRGCKIPRFRHAAFAHCDGAEDVNIPFWNLPGWRHFSIYHNSKRYIKTWVKAHPCGTVMAYGLTLRNVCRLLYAKRISDRIKTCMIVPDLPLYMRLSAGWGYRMAKSVENWLICRQLHKIDGYVLLAKAMNDMVKAKHYCVMEGICCADFLEPQEQQSCNIVLYAGTLDKKYGIGQLLEAFHNIADPAVRLYLCGMGDSQSLVEEMVRQDDRICYFGQLSRPEILALQSCASVLVNPRQNTEAYTKYSFPSKNLEYLSSGVPLVAYKLDGIPDEYDPYIHYVPDHTVQALQHTIEQVLSYSPQERRQIGARAREFVQTQKNAVVQAKKILDMLQHI